jgi:hypothetical protein
MMSLGDSIAALSNVVLTASVIGGGLIAFSRWNVQFAIQPLEKPSHGESYDEDGPVVETINWLCRLNLVGGKVAHISRIKLERRNSWGFWRQEKDAALPYVRMPLSISEADAFQFVVSIVKETRGPFRLKVEEYATMRSVLVPFVEPERVDDSEDDFEE